MRTRYKASKLYKFLFLNIFTLKNKSPGLAKSFFMSDSKETGLFNILPDSPHHQGGLSQGAEDRFLSQPILQLFAYQQIIHYKKEYIFRQDGISIPENAFFQAGRDYSLLEEFDRCLPYES